MSLELNALILAATGAQAIVQKTLIQSLWSGYGNIVRVDLEGGNYPSIVLKHIKLPNEQNHPRGWDTGLSHQRKIRSYKIEANWYRHYAQHCQPACKVPVCLAEHSDNDETILVLTDLDVSGYNVRKTSVDRHDIEACLRWLATFHATFLNSPNDGLWECGTYWHLDTRPDELHALDDLNLKKAAPLIDQQLTQCRYQTLVHGDAKLANFCFTDRTKQHKTTDNIQDVAALDFQYVGRGCGMKDVVYFIGSCLDENECETMQNQFLDYYFACLRDCLAHKKNTVNIAELESSWRQLYPFAWADFHRFIKGWSPGHWKINDFSERITQSVIEDLGM